MFSRQIRESDWKLFRQLRSLALERFCQRVLSDVERIASDSSKSNHDRYLDLYRHLHEQDKELRMQFDDPRRSTVLQQLAGLQARELLTEEELVRFSPETREAVELMLRPWRT